MTRIQFLLLWTGLTSVVAFLAHLLDKWAAVQGTRRVPEATLHFLALLGGWPGALLAMRVAHHKTRKASFLAVTFGIVALHGVLAFVAWRQGWIPT